MCACVDWGQPGALHGALSHRSFNSVKLCQAVAPLLTLTRKLRQREGDNRFHMEITKDVENVLSFGEMYISARYKAFSTAVGVGEQL